MPIRKAKDNTARKAEKKSEMLDVRLPYGLKQALVKACRAEGTTVSDTVRALISDYVAEAEVSNAKPALKDLTMTIAKNPRKTLAMSAAAAFSAFVFAAQPSMADDTLFASFDTNENGVLTAEEIDHEVIAALDTDYNGEIKLAEFKPYTTLEGTNDDIRAFPGEDAAREIKVSHSIIDLREPGNASISRWTASETIDLDATDAEVEAMIENLKSKVNAGKAKGPLAPRSSD